MAVDPARAKSLFLAASDLADPAERAAYLDRECGGDAELRPGSRRCSPPTTAAARFLESDATGVSEPTSPETLEATAAARAETRLPSELATGGSRSDGGLHARRRPAGRPPRRIRARARSSPAGTRCSKSSARGAWAPSTGPSRPQPVKRQVALKLIKIGMDSRAVLARFDAERQALALMDHPNIARVYDGGTTEAGQPFFVMELVSGVPITEYCDRKRLPVRARLELFVAVCQAVQHAHQKGIIHRDLKPSNVMVTEVDGRPTPKVIDFGVAKATEFEPHRPEPGRHRRDRRHADVHVARAGRPVVDGHRHPDRRLCAGRDPLRAAGRLAADRREAVQAGGDPGDAADGAGGRPAQAEHQGEHGGCVAEHRGQPRHRAGAPEAGACRGTSTGS